MAAAKKKTPRRRAKKAPAKKADPPTQLMPKDADETNKADAIHASAKETRSSATKRLRKGQLPVDWDAVSREYVFGYIDEDPKSGDFKRIYPSLAELSRRLRVPLPALSYHCGKGKWTERREKFVAQLRREVDLEVAKARALSTGDSVAILDTYIKRFGRAVEEDAVGRSSIKDLEIAIRTKAMLEREANTASQSLPIGLEEIQIRHKRIREQATALSGRTLGFIPGRTEREAEAEADRVQARAAQGQDVTPEEPTVDPDVTKPPRPVTPKAQRPATAAQAALAELRAKREANGITQGWRGPGVPPKRDAWAEVEAMCV